jgi:phosphoribosyl-ATP pyrophosphohydrolase/phosphoribosyl-AMP cyclohydrolase/histidinol dehydrogenase
VGVVAEDVGALGKEHGVHVVSYDVAGLSEEEKEEERGESAASSSASPSTSASLAPLNAGVALVSCLRTDRADGLYTTVVCDECGVALGLVYSSAESVCESLRSGRGVYYSRSRKGLWRKGATSGAVQELVSVRFDCDSDALRFCVRQKGSPPSFCHTGNRSCWGPAEGLRHLQETLQSRLVTAPAGSYTKRLFDDDTLLRNKLLEEAQELSEAVEPDHVAAEAADVMYFAMVAAVKGGADLEAIERHLNARTLKIKRRPGNSKPERIAAAAAELDAIRAKKKRKVGGE